MSREYLEGMNVKALVKMAGEFHVVGRHDMRKEELIQNIMVRQGSDPVEEIVEERKVQDQMVEDVEPTLYFEEPSNDPEIELAKLDAVQVWEDSEHSCSGQCACQSKGKGGYLESAKIGDLVAFKVDSSKMLSGKIEEIHKDSFVIETKNGIKFVVKKQNIAWVKTGPKWPKGIYHALKGIKEEQRNEIQGE